jgi:hypothetical protein
MRMNLTIDIFIISENTNLWKIEFYIFETVFDKVA